MGTARVKEEREADTINNIERLRNLEEINVGTMEKSPKQGLISPEDLTMMLPEGRHSSYYRSVLHVLLKH